MEIDIIPLESSQIDAVVDLSLRAWASVFPSIEAAMDPEVYREFFPDWRVSQAKAVREACADDNMNVWTAVDGGDVAGFVALRLDAESKVGEIYLIAVDPAHQKRGIASALTDFAMARMKEAGMTVAMVETGADPGHAPARRTYEKAGFRNLPAARYFKKL